MISIRLPKNSMLGLLVSSAFCIALSLPVASQVQTTETVKHGPSVHEVNIERGKIVYVSGDDVLIKTEDGVLRDLDLAEGETINIEGKQLNAHQLQVGMNVEKQTVTTTTPRVITKVESVTGKVWHVAPPNSVTLTLENGKNQSFMIPKDTKFTVNGRETDAWGLKKGMSVSAQRVTEIPENVLTQTTKHTGTMPTPPAELTQGMPILIVMVRRAPAAAEVAQAESTPEQLPKTASELPLVGLLGVLLCGISLAMMAVRKLPTRI